MCERRHHGHNRHRILWFPIFAMVATLAIGLVPEISSARKELLTSEEKERLRLTERIALEMLALTRHGVADATPLASTAKARLEDIGYRVVLEAGPPSDVTIKIKCEEVKTWEGPGLSGGDADLVDAAARLWRGPACQMSYRLGTRTADWRHEVRIETPQSGDPDTGARALAALGARLRTDDFPYLLAAEWNQPARLITALDSPGATGRQKNMLIGLIGGMASVESIPRLTAALNDPDPTVTEAAASALGVIGHQDAIVPLQSLFTSGTPEQRRIAAVGLGRLAPLHPTSTIVPMFITALPREPVSTQIIIVRALGRTNDRRILEPLRVLHRTVLKIPPENMTAELKELKTTLGIALDQFDDGMHAD